MTETRNIRKDARDRSDATRCDQHRDHSSEHDDLSVKRDEARHQRSESQEGRQVEDVRSNYDASTDAALMVRQGRHRRGDLRSVRGKRGEDTE